MTTYDPSDSEAFNPVTQLLGHPFTPPAAEAPNGYEPWPDEIPPDHESANPTQARLTELRKALVDTTTLDTIPDPEPLIDGILYRDSLSWLYGKPGSGKSFVALDWAASVATGTPWHTRTVTPGPVLYLVAEGVRGMRKRVRAWETANQQAMTGVTFLPIAVQLLHGTDRQALLALVEELQPALVIIDTQARCTVGASENDAGEMGRVVAAGDLIRTASSACVLMVHHSGKNGLDLRGSSAFEGAATSIIKVNKDGTRLDVISDKQKDEDDFEPIRLRMTPTGNSLVLTASDLGSNAARSEAQQQIITELRQSFGSNGASSTQLLKTTGIPERSFYRELKALVDAYAVAKVGTLARPRYFAPEHTPQPTLPKLPKTATAASEY